jgi:hypothetical protein
MSIKPITTELIAKPRQQSDRCTNRHALSRERNAMGAANVSLPSNMRLSKNGRQTKADGPHGAVRSVLTALLSTFSAQTEEATRPGDRLQELSVAQSGPRCRALPPRRQAADGVFPKRSRAMRGTSPRTGEFPPPARCSGGSRSMLRSLPRRRRSPRHPWADEAPSG